MPSLSVIIYQTELEQKLDKRGVVLLSVVLIIIFFSVAALAITTYIIESTRLNLTNIDQQKAIYAAQAGVMYAMVDYINNGSITEVSDVSVATDTSFSIGGSGMFFLADCSNPTIIAGRKLKDVNMTNLNSTNAVTITHMQVSWTPDGGENLISIDLGRATVEWSGTAQSGTNIDMLDYTIGAGVTENDVWLDWETGTNIVPMIVSAILTFSDGSTVEILLLNAGHGSDNAIVITSTGETATTFTCKRTLKAAYDIGTNEIVSWEESEDHL